MSADLYVSESGVVLWEPDDRTRRVKTVGGYVLSSGRLCSACLSGTWPSTLLRSKQYVCDTCRALDMHLTQLAVADAPAVTRSEDQREAAVAHRATRLAQAFTVAAGLGLPRVKRRDDTFLTWNNYADLVPQGEQERARRYVEWLRTVAPDAAPKREPYLGDLYALAQACRNYEKAARLAHARQSMVRTLRQVSAIPHRLTYDLAEIVKVALPQKGTK